MTVFVLICQDFTSRLPSFWVNLARERRQREREKLRRDEKKIIKDFEDNTAGIICNILSARVNHGGFNVEEKNTYLSCPVPYHSRIDAPIVRFIFIHCHPSTTFVLAVCGAIYFATDFIIFSFSFIHIYVCFISKDNASLFSTREKERMRKGARIASGMKKTEWNAWVRVVFPDNSGFYWIIPTNKEASQICSCIEHGSALSCLSSHNFATSFR